MRRVNPTRQTRQQCRHPRLVPRKVPGFLQGLSAPSGASGRGRPCCLWSFYLGPVCRSKAHGSSLIQATVQILSDRNKAPTFAGLLLLWTILHALHHMTGHTIYAMNVDDSYSRQPYVLP